MTTNLALAAFKVTGGTLSRTFADRFTDTVNVKDFGAKGDGSTDDTTAIINALTAAGLVNTGSKVGGQKPVFFPAGNYIISASLPIRMNYGGHIFGAGKDTTTITYTGAGNAGNSVVDGVSNPLSATITAIFVIASSQNVLFEDFTVSGTTGNRTSGSSSTTGFFAYTPFGTPHSPYTNGSGITTACYFSNIKCQNLQYGMLFAHSGDGIPNCENMVVVSCDFDQCDSNGVRASGQNSLNHTVIGGLFSNCGAQFNGNVSTPTQGALFGAIGGDGGTYNLISAPRFANNVVDVNTSGQTTIVGGISVGGPSTVASIILGFGASSLIGFTYAGLSTATAIICIAGPFSITSCVYNPPTNTGAGIILRAHNSTVNFDNNKIFNTAKSGGVFNCGIVGPANIFSIVNCRNNDFDGTPFPPVVGGTTPQFVMNHAAPVTVASLPAASTPFKGVKLTVTDSSVTTFGSTVSGGGSNIVPVWCDGTNWKVG